MTDTNQTTEAPASVDNPLSRFAKAAVRVMTSNTYPLAGHIRDELVEAAAALEETGSGSPGGAALDLAPILDEGRKAIAEHVENLKAELGTSLTNSVAEVQSQLAATVAQAKADLQTASDKAAADVQDAAKAASDVGVKAVTDAASAAAAAAKANKPS